MMETPDLGDLPPELLSHPQAFIAFLGLDTANNPAHSAIWDSFSSSRRTEKSPLLMKMVKPNHQFPLKKPKKPSFEWHVPKGIFKTNWLSKHLFLVPAVAVRFYDLDWDDPCWADKLIDVVTKVTSLRDSLKDRNTRIALVLIQKTIPLPGGENTEATEKAAELCSICELSAKSLFALPHSDHLHGYTMRMEGAFYELAQNYYQQESKRIKNNRDMLNKTTQQLLFVRYQFKMAFFNELKQDLLQALKNYKQAYAYLMEVRASDTNMLEVKTVGGFINFKICSVSFKLNKPLDSISQFRKHVDIFRSKVGPQEVAFEHNAWMAKQYSYFGDLFEEAVNQGLTAIQTQHPGFYYQQAATCAVSRKVLCQKLCKETPQAYPNPDPMENAKFVEFYGQRPWRPGVQSIEPHDFQQEKLGYLALQIKEAQINHSNLIIIHLRNAVTQFKKYKCPRLKRQLMVQMGQEYHYSQENSKALALLSHVLWHYRIEKWCPLVSNILLTALKCAFLSGNVQEYLSLGLEAISSWIQCSSEDKTHIQSNINSIISGNLPIPSATLTAEEIKSSEVLWNDSLLAIKNKPLIFTIPMTNVTPFVECKAMFTSKHFHADEKVLLKVYLRTNCPQLVKFTKLSVMFGNHVYNKPKFCEIPNEKQMLGENGNLNLAPNKTRLFTFSFLPSPADVNGTIPITQIALQLGSEKSICAVLVWPDTSSEQLGSSEDIQKEFPSTSFASTDDLNFHELVEQKTTMILPREPRLGIHVTHKTPVLKLELYPLLLSLTCEERNQISSLTVCLSLDQQYENPDIVEYTEFYDTLPIKDSTPKNREIKGLNLGQLAPGAMVEQCFFMKALSIHQRNIIFRVTYTTEVDVDDETLSCQCTKEELISFDMKEPFYFTPQLLNLKFQPVQYARAEEHFLLRLDIQSCSSLCVELKNSNLSLTKYFSATEEDLTSQVSGLELNQDEIASDCYCIFAPTDVSDLVSLGVYTLTWRRKSPQRDIPWVQQVFRLPNTNVVKMPLYAELEAPSHGCVRTPMTICYTLHNRSNTVQELSLVVDGSDAFMYAGNKQLHFWILPRNSYKLVYNLYPLVSGCVQLPKLKLLLNPGKSTAYPLDDLLQELLPSHMFIMPQGKAPQVLDESRSA